MKCLTFHDGISGLSSPDTQGLKHLLESVLGLVLGREDDGGGLPAAVTHPEGGQDLLEEGTSGYDLQPGGGSQESGPLVDVDVVEFGSGHDWTWERPLWASRLESPELIFEYGTAFTFYLEIYLC